MNSYKEKHGFTLVELLIVITVIAILSSLVITTAARIQSKAKEQLTENTIAILTAALEQFRDAGYRYDNSVVDYSEFDFPLDCNDPVKHPFDETLKNALGATTVLIGPAGGHKVEDSECEAMYFFLSRVPECREILDKIDRSLITSEGANKQAMSIVIDFSGNSRTYPLLRVIDPWGKTLRYNYYKDKINPKDRKNFPLVASAGPDKQFETSDDISNKK